MGQRNRQPTIAVGTCGATPTKIGWSRVYARYEERREARNLFRYLSDDGASHTVGFRFTAKLPGTGTHLQASDVHDDVRLFRRKPHARARCRQIQLRAHAVSELVHPTGATREYLRRLRDTLEDVTLVAEFRHRE